MTTINSKNSVSEHSGAGKIRKNRARILGLLAGGVLATLVGNSILSNSTVRLKMFEMKLLYDKSRTEDPEIKKEYDNLIKQLHFLEEQGIENTPEESNEDQKKNPQKYHPYNPDDEGRIVEA